MGLNDFHDYIDEMEFGEDSRHIDSEIPGNVESQTVHINEGATCYPNEGIVDEELGLIVEDIESEGDSEDEQVRDDDCELPIMHEYEEEGEDEEVDFDVEDEQVQVPIMFNKYRHLKTPALIPNMIFGNAEEFRSMIRKYALVTRRDVKLPINEKHRVQAVCRVNGCPFKIFCSKNGSQDNMSIKTISGAYLWARDQE
ncbi:hypothetical protein LIER_24531 [Lithospermum erythrorhizon]|uniref:Transposase MuDR plant domain-containing protein n=1 Tax=Lithospermum erythrorhizon TaxID=34254 RepID=A0AAV3R558_LITER